MMTVIANQQPRTPQGEVQVPTTTSTSSVGGVNETFNTTNHNEDNDQFIDPNGYPLPSNIATSAADFFDGVLGDYELNEIPSLFNLDSHQQMSADLEALGFSTSGSEGGTSVDGSNYGDQQDLPFVVSSNTLSASGQVSVATTHDSEDESAMNEHERESSEAQTAAGVGTTKSSKRSAAEISEDEDSSASSKARRLTRSANNNKASNSRGSKVVNDNLATSKRLLAPKPPPSSSGSSRSSSRKSGSINGDDESRNVDTSTAHVKALTGAKGAAMCFEIVAGTPQDTTVAIPNLASADLSPEEKAKFSRDRNRLHARNTRIRKKAYVDELKRTLDVLVQERDNAMAAKNQKMQIEMEEREVRFSVMEEFLRLRGCNEQSPARWNAILEDDVTLRLPNVYWSHLNKCNGVSSNSNGIAEDSPSKKMAPGVVELMEECNDFAGLLQQQGKMKGSTKKSMVGSLNYQCDRSTLLMEGSNVVLDWTATSTNPKKSDFSMRGTFRASFNPQSNRMNAIDIFFDSSPIFALSN